MRADLDLATRRLFVAVGLLTVVACGNAGESLGIVLPGTGAITAVVFFDRDGSGPAPTAGDTIVGGARVGLVALTTQDTVATLLTDAQGVAKFTGIPIGKYRLVVDSSTIGDSLRLAGIDSTQFSVVSGANPKLIAARLTFPFVTIRQARLSTAGIKLWVTGVMTVPTGDFGDTTAHLSDSSGALRVTNAVTNPGGLVAFVGDSVRILGTVSSRGSQPTLDQSVIYVNAFGTSQPTGTPLTTALAATANGGQADAALVTIAGGVIIDTATVGADLVVHVDDGSGILEMLLDGDVTFTTSLFAPGLTVAGSGVLIPAGPGNWQFKPRFPGDITVS